MKKAYFVISILLLFAGCTSKQPAKITVDAARQVSPLIIDHPAVVVINPSGIKPTLAIEDEKGSIQKILSPFGIPLIASNTENLEFIKNNGDKIRFDLNHLTSHYDVILFNAINDPVPCYLKDLKHAARMCFQSQIKTPANTSKELHQGTKLIHKIPDTSDQFRISDITSSFTKNHKPIHLTVPDTSSIPISLRNLPGIKWIENRPDTRSFLRITFENDLITYANTDRYFTNGITISLQSPRLGKSEAARLLLPYRHNSTVTYSLDLVQNMYTPKDTKVAPTFINDRPYASYLYLGFSKISIDPIRKIRMTSELDLGYLGPKSPGAYLQTLVHESFPTNDKPQGWASQIKTDVILNYAIKAEKCIVQQAAFMVAASASAKAGTLYSRTGLGFRLQAGKQEPYFCSGTTKTSSSWQYFFFIDAESSFIAYDATLQGGVFTKDNIFSLRKSEITRWVSSTQAGVEIRYKGTGLELAQHYLSPEYKGGLSHKWGRISLIFKL